MAFPFNVPAIMVLPFNVFAFIVSPSRVPVLIASPLSVSAFIVLQFKVPDLMRFAFKVPAFIQSATMPSVARIFKTAFPFLSTPAIYVLPPSDDIKIPSTVFFHIVLLSDKFSLSCI